MDTKPASRIACRCVESVDWDTASASQSSQTQSSPLRKTARTRTLVGSANAFAVKTNSFTKTTYRQMPMHCQRSLLKEAESSSRCDQRARLPRAATTNRSRLRPFVESFVFTDEWLQNVRPKQKIRLQIMKTQELENDTVKQTVRELYGRIAEQDGSCGCAPTCCSPSEGAIEGRQDAAAISRTLGYSAEETGTTPEGSNLGLGCGNPQARCRKRLGCR